MNTHRLNITIPKTIMALLKNKPNKSAFIAAAIREKLEAEERLKRDEALAEAYRESAKEDRALVRDWDRLAGDGL